MTISNFDDVRQLCLKLLGCAVRMFAKFGPMASDVAEQVGSFLEEKDTQEIIALVKETKNVVLSDLDWSDQDDAIDIAIELLRAILDVAEADPRDFLGKPTEPHPAVSAYLAEAFALPRLSDLAESKMDAVAWGHRPAPILDSQAGRRDVSLQNLAPTEIKATN